MKKYQLVIPCTELVTYSDNLFILEKLGDCTNAIFGVTLGWYIVDTTTLDIVSHKSVESAKNDGPSAMLFNIFMSICQLEAKAWNKSMESDCWNGANIALDFVIQQLSELPELEGYPQVKRAKEQIAQSYPAI